MNRTSRTLIIIAASVALTACAAGANPLSEAAAPAGFWLGLWHGMIAPVTLLISTFSDSVSLYEVRNNGGWYDLGFVLGIGCSFGGSNYQGRRNR